MAQMTFEEFIQEWRNDSDFISVRTSGSTGEPKVIKLEKDFVKESALRTNSFFGIDLNSYLYSCVGADYIGGKMMAVRAEISDAKFSWEKPSNHPLKEIKNIERIDLLAVVPSQMLYILENKNNLPEIRNIIVGGAPVPFSLCNKIADSGLNVWETYGMTETASHIALRKIQIPDSDSRIQLSLCDSNKKEQKNIFESNYFKCLPGISIDLDQESCLKIIFDSGKIIQTNDIAKIKKNAKVNLKSSEFIIKGRRDNVIISGGKKINPESLEKIISDLISWPFILYGVKDEKWGEKLALAIEISDQNINFDQTRNLLNEKLRNRLEGWQIPKEINFVKRLPRTSNGKLMRKINL